jgi:hypothetical protein
MARRARNRSADLGDGDGASQAGRAGGCLDDLEGMHPGLGGDGILAMASAGGEERRQLEP